MHRIALADLSEKLSSFTIAISFESDRERDIAVTTATKIVMELEGSSGPSRELEIRTKAEELAA